MLGHLDEYDDTVAAPLTAFLVLNDIFACALASASCRQLCRKAVQALNLQASDAEPSRALQRLARSSLTDCGASIREINAAFCQTVGSETLKTLPKLPVLQSINLDGCQSIGDDGLIALAQRCSGLRSFSLYWNVKVTDKGLCRVLRAQQGQQLRELNLSGCKQLSDETVQRIVSKAPGLEVLDLTRCNQVTDMGVLLVCECLERLRILRLFAMGQLNPKAFTSLHKLVHLEELDLCGCRSIEDQDFVRWADTSAPSRLQILNLTWCIALTDAALLAVARSCPRLQWLSVFGNLNITSGAVEMLAAAPCGRLIHSLDVRGLKQASEYSTSSEALRRLFPAVRHTELAH